MKNPSSKSAAARSAFKPSPKMLAHLKRLNRAIRLGKVKVSRPSKPSPALLAHLKRLNRAIRQGKIKTGGAR